MEQTEQDHYRVLGLEPHARPAEIKRAYRRRALQTHPDREGDPESFRRVRRAYEVLSDVRRRRRYDRTLGARSGTAHTSPRFEALFTDLLRGLRATTDLPKRPDPVHRDRPEERTG